MTTTVRIFIHGSSHGAWCWKDVLAILQEENSAVNVAVDLPGCGQDDTPRQLVTLTSQVESILAVVDSHPYQAVELIGHSLAGFLLAEVAVRRPERIARMLSLAGMILPRGRRAFDELPTQRQEAYLRQAEASEDFSVLATFDNAWARFFNHLDESHARAAYQQLTPQPLQPYLDPVGYVPSDTSCPLTYVACDDDRTFPLSEATLFAHRAGVEPVVMSGDHCVMLSDPGAVADLVLQHERLA